jgi:endonuclease/exonuclease/phosphatase family metal-dependent hydrolase
MLFAAVYRTWTDTEGSTGTRVEQSHLATLINQIQRATEPRETPRFVLMGDFNLDIERKTDATYGRRKLTNEFAATTEATGLEYLPTVPTFHSYGRFLDGQVRVQRHSTIDHCYVLGVRAAVRALPDATTDHLPLLLVVDPGRVSDSSNSTKNITSRTF